MFWFYQKTNKAKFGLEKFMKRGKHFPFSLANWILRVNPIIKQCHWGWNIDTMQTNKPGLIDSKILSQTTKKTLSPGKCRQPSIVFFRLLSPPPHSLPRPPLPPLRPPPLTLPLPPVSPPLLLPHPGLWWLARPRRPPSLPPHPGLGWLARPQLPRSVLLGVWSAENRLEFADIDQYF